MKSLKTQLLSYRRLFIWTVGILLLYTLLGFLFLPWLAERQLVNTLQQRLELESTVDKISFNPYTFELNIDGLDINTKDKQPLASWNSLYINLDPSQLIKKTILVKSIEIASADIHFRRYTPTDNTLIRLANAWNETAVEDNETSGTAKAAEKSEEAPFFNIAIEHAEYKDGQFHYLDKVPDDSFETVLTPINFQLNNFTTKADSNAQNSLLVGLGEKAKLKLDGELSLSPLFMSGRLSLSEFNLQTPYQYFKAQLPVELKSGHLDVKLDYDIRLSAIEPNIDIKNTAITLSKLDVFQPGDATALLSNGRLEVAGGHYRFPENQLTLEKIAITDTSLSAKRNKQGQINWLQLVDAIPKTANDKAEADTSAPAFGLTISEMALNNVDLAIDDQQPELPSKLSLTLAANLKNFSLADDQAMPFSSEIKLSTGGEVSASGNLQLFPNVSVNADSQINQLSLKPLQPYLSEFALVELKEGKLDAKAAIKSDKEDALLVKGDLALSVLQLDNQTLNEKLFAIDKLALKTIDFSLQNKDLAISDIEVNKLYSRIFINKDGVTNLRMLVKEQAEQISPKQKKATSDESANPYKISIGQVKIKEASSRFTDESLPIVFDTQMRSLDGEISGFSTQSDQAVELNLEGQVQEFGMVEINGSLAPLAITEKSNIDLAFSNLNLPEMSPYTIKFAGRKIADGRADVKLSYKISKGALNASNSLVIRDIRLGERVASPNAVDLPLDLAVALLKNSEGVIDLSIPVTGDVNNPQFEMGPAIRKAVFNAIRNIVTSPFRFLANLVGGGDDSIKSLAFSPGRDQLTPPQKETLLKLTEALAKRPQLVLYIPAPYAELVDRETLRVKAVEQKIDAALEKTDPEEQLLQRRQVILERLYTEQGLTPDLSTIKQSVIAESTPAEGETPTLDLLAYNARLKARLVESQTVSEATLKDLALSRQKAVMAYLEEEGKLTASQLHADEVKAVKPKDGGVMMNFDVRAK